MSELEEQINEASMQFDESHIKDLRQSGCCVPDYDAMSSVDR